MMGSHGGGQIQTTMCRENVKVLAEGTSAAAQDVGIDGAQGRAIVVMTGTTTLPIDSIRSGLGMTAIIGLWLIGEGMG